MDRSSIRERILLDAFNHASQPKPAWKRLAMAATPITCMGLPFPNRLGIAAGFDCSGKLGRMAGNLGFGSIELGSWTQDSWPESPPPVSPKTLLDTRLGVRLAAIAPMSPEQETLQLGRLMERAWASADYLTLAPGWLEHPVPFRQLDANLCTLQEVQQSLVRQTRKPCPVVYKLKIMPGNEGSFKLAHYLACQGVDGILISFDFGKPATKARYDRWRDPTLQAATCRTLEAYQRHINGNSALLTNGGVLSRQDYLSRLHAGADLVQLHNALVLKGVDIGWEINR